MTHAPAIDMAGWAGPGAQPGLRAALRRPWHFLLSLIVPPRGQKVVPTKAGVVLIVLALALGLAAYHTGSNILFITLSLLLSTIILSGVLSWLNFRATAWRVEFQSPFRAGQPAVAVLDLLNRKRFLPTYSLGFDFRVSSGDSGRLVLRRRLDPGETRRMEWAFTPRRRGRELVEMNGVGSQFPFGFLYKHFGGRHAREIYVWPARIRYRADFRALPAPETHGDVLNRVGSGTDLVNLRQYQPGDSHRHIHWKASARQRRLMTRQLREENHSGYFLVLETPASAWRRRDQFERLCSLVASLAEDLFRQGRLEGAVVNGGPPCHIQRVSDLELFLDQLAVLEPVDDRRSAYNLPKRNVIRFEPGYPDGVHAIIRGQKSASA